MEELLKNEFQFYSKLAKPLVLNLPKSKDRILAAAWIKKFRNEDAGSENLRTIYLKLLLFCLQRRKLIGIFADDPKNYDVLEELPEDIDLNEFARNLLAQDRVERAEMIRLEMMGDMDTFPAYTTDCSPDLTEYVAAQDIPNFGVHAYYAISKQPVNKWQRSDKAVLPKGAKSAIDTSIAAATATSGCVCSPKGTASAPEVDEAAGDGAEHDCRKKNKGSEKKKRRPRKFGTSPPTHPIGEVRHPAEERLTPTWGTNLMQVHEQTEMGKIEEPSDTAKALEEEVSRMMEAKLEAEQDEEEDMDDIASKAEEMVHVLDEVKRGKMDKAKKPPSRLAKLCDRSGIKAPKSIKEPKIAVRGMKKNKGKGGFGPRPANLPKEFADWTEKDLEEAALTWADLMPIEENIDDELQRIEDEEMADTEAEDLQVEKLPFEEFDYDEMIREAEADLAMEKTIYDAGVEEDEPVVELFDDEAEDMHDQFDISRTAEEVRTASPAMTSGIPVTTPQRSASPRRFRSPERLFAQEDDELLKHRQSPLRPPKEKRKETPRKPKRSQSPPEPTDKDLNISKVFKKAKKIARERSHERQVEDEDEFERLERQFEGEVREASATSRMRTPSPPRRPLMAFSPGDAERVRQRARQQEQLLRTPDPSYDRFEQDFQEAHGSLENISPCGTCGSPPAWADEDEEFEFRENMYREQSPRAATALRSPTTGTILPQVPDFDYGPEDVGYVDPMQAYMPEFRYGSEDLGRCPERYETSDTEGSLGLLSPSAYQTPPRRLPTQQEQEHQRQQVLMRARQQEALLRHGSPEANAIIEEAERSFAEDIFRREVAEQKKLLEESPPPTMASPSKTPQRPQFDVQPAADPGAEWKREEEDLRAQHGGPEGEYGSSPCRDDVRAASPPRVGSPCQRESPRSISQTPQEAGPQQTPFQPDILTPVPQRPIGYKSPPYSPSPCPYEPEGYRSLSVYGPKERPRSYMTPEILELDDYPPGLDEVEAPDFEELPEDASASPGYCWSGMRMDDVQPPGELFSASPNIYSSCLDAVEPPDFGELPEDIYSPQRGYDRGLDTIEPPDFEQLPEESPASLAPCTPARRLQRPGQVLMKPRQLFAEETQETCVPCGDDEEPTKQRSRPKRRQKRSKRRSPDDDFEEMERRFEAEEADAAAPRRRRPLPDLQFSPGEAARVRQRAREQENLLRMSSSTAADDEEFERLERQFAAENASSPCAVRRMEFPPADVQRVHERAQQQEKLLRQDLPSVQQRSRAGTPTRPTRRELFEEELDRRKVISPMPCPQTPVRSASPVWSTPADMSGPSRRRTGRTPPVYDSDNSPPPTPQMPLRFAPAKRIRKRGPKRPKGPCSPMLPLNQRPRSGTPTQSTRRQFDDELLLDRRKVVSPMPCPQTPAQLSRAASPVWSTPEDMSGPSRRRTGKTPPVYDSDHSPPPTPRLPPRFAPAKRIQKRGRYPPPADSLKRFEPPPSEDLDMSGYEETFQRILEANLKVPPEQYPPPERTVCAGARKALAPSSARELGSFDVEKERQLAFAAAARSGDLLDHLAQREFEDIADQADLMFDYEEGLLDTSPPLDDLDRNYYPDIQKAARALIKSVQDYDLPESPVVGQPCRSPSREPSRSPRRIPPPQVVAPAPCSGDVRKMPSESRIPQQKPLRETRSSQLRKATIAKQRQTEKEAQQKQERIAQKKMKAQEKKRAEVEAKRRAEPESGEARERTARTIPGGRMRPPDYRLAKGTTDVATRSAQKEVHQGIQGQVDERIRRNLFGGQLSTISNRLGSTKRPGKQRLLGMKGPGDPRAGPEFIEELREHEVQFPGYREDVVVKGRLKAVRRKSQQAFKQMDYIEEEEGGSPCTPCGGGEEGEEDEYQATLRKTGVMEEADEEEGEAAMRETAKVVAGPSRRLEQPRQLTRRQQRMLDQLQEIDQRPQTSPVLTEFEKIERAVIRREQEDREYFEQVMRGEIQQRVSPERGRPMTEEEELQEFEELERRAAMEDQACPGAEQQRDSRRSACRAEGITYSPPRPRTKFGPYPQQQPARHLPPISSQRPSSRSQSSCPPTPPSPPPLEPEMEDLDAVLPPVFYEMDEEDRLPIVDPPCARSPARRTASPSRQASSPQTPERLRQQIASMARPEFDPALRVDILRREERRAIRAPCGMPEVQEEEPLIPCLAEAQPAREEPDVRRRRRREPEQRRQRQKKGPVEYPEVTSYMTELEQKFNLPPLESPEQEEYHVLDESLPRDLPSPMQPCQPPLVSPPRMLPVRRIPRQPWEEPSPPCATLPFTPPRHTELYVPPENVRIHPDLRDLAYYEPPFEVPEGVDLLDEQDAQEMFFTPPRYPETDEMEMDREAAREWQAPWTVQRPGFVTPEEMGLQAPSSVGRGPCRSYTPTATPPLGLLDESLLERMDDAMLLTPPGGAGPCREELDRFFAATPPLEQEVFPQELRYRIPCAEGTEGLKRWYGRGGARNVIPEVDEPIFSLPTHGTIPPQLPEPCSQWSPTLDEFERLEREAEEATCRRRRKKPKAQLDFEERRRRGMIDEMAEESDRLLMMSPEQKEFQQMEQQFLEEERGRQVSERRRKQREFEEIQRRTAIEEMGVEAERVQMEYARAPSPRMRRTMPPSRSRTPPPRVFQGEAGGPCGTCGSPEAPDLSPLYVEGPMDLLDDDAGLQAAIEGYESPEPLSQSWRDQVLHMDEEGLKYRMLNEIVFDPHAYPLEDPRSPQMLDQDHDMRAAIEGYESPEPLAQSWREQVGACGTCGSPRLEMNQAEMQQRMFEDGSFDQRPYQWEEVRNPQMLDEDEGVREMIEGYQSPEPLSQSWREQDGAYGPCAAPVHDPYAYPLEDPRSPQMLDNEMLCDALGEYQTPPPLSPAMRRGYYTEADEARRQQYLDRESQEIRQTFGPSPAPPSPGRDADFYANVPRTCRTGDRPRSAAREQMATRRPPSLDPITEQSQMCKGTRPRSAPTRAGVRFPSASRLATSQQATPSSSAQRVAEARRHYQQGSRSQSSTRRQTPCSGAQPREQEQAEAQRRNKDSFRSRGRQGDATTSAGTGRERSRGLPTQSCRSFMPRQVQMQMASTSAQQPQREEPRRTVRRTSSIKKIVTKKN